MITIVTLLNWQSIVFPLNDDVKVRDDHKRCGGVGIHVHANLFQFIRKQFGKKFRNISVLPTMIPHPRKYSK